MPDQGVNSQSLRECQKTLVVSPVHERLIVALQGLQKNGHLRRILVGDDLVEDEGE